MTTIYIHSCVHYELERDIERIRGRYKNYQPLITVEQSKIFKQKGG